MLFCGSRGDKPTPTPTGEHPNDDGQRQDEQPTRTTPDERQEEKRQERNASRTADQQNGKHGKQSRNREETTQGEENGRSEPTPTDDERESREPTTQETPPKNFICLLALNSIYQVFNYKVKGLARRTAPTATAVGVGGRNPHAVKPPTAALDVPTFDIMRSAKGK